LIWQANLLHAHSFLGDLRFRADYQQSAKPADAIPVRVNKNETPGVKV